MPSYAPSAPSTAGHGDAPAERHADETGRAGRSIRHGRLVRILAAAVLAGGVLTVVAQTAPGTPAAPAAPAAAAPGASTPAGTAAKGAAAPAKPAPAPAKRVPTKPLWTELTPPQQQALNPLVTEWEFMGRAQKLKWLEVANHYPAMKPEEQQRSQERMREWVRLTPEQRRVARDSYTRVQTMPPEKRAELFQKYQQLPEEKKRALAAEAKSSKTLTPVKPPSKQAPHQPTPSTAQIRQGLARGGAFKPPTPVNPIVPAVPAAPAAPAPPAAPAAAPAAPAAESAAPAVDTSGKP